MRIQPALLFTALISFVLLSCGDNSKRIMIMANGNISVNKNMVTLSGGTTHNEQYVTVSEDNIQVSGPDGEKTIELKDGAGLYLLNLKKDTLVGSYQRVGTNSDQIRVSRTELKMQLDSLIDLQQGRNVTVENRNYWIPPYQASKITDNKQAEIFGPFNPLPSSSESGKEHEIYKCHTNKGVNEIIERLRPMTEDSVDG